MTTRKELNDFIRNKGLSKDDDTQGLTGQSMTKVLHGMPIEQARREQEADQKTLKAFEKKLDVATLAEVVAYKDLTGCSFKQALKHVGDLARHPDPIPTVNDWIRLQSGHLPTTPAPNPNSNDKKEGE